MGSPPTLAMRGSVPWARRFARTTPGVVSIIAVAVASFCVLAGLVCGGQLDGRIAKHNAVLDRSEPLAYSAQNLYAALSAADAAAASAFLSGGIETGAVQARYRQALADAASALTDVTAGTTDTETRTAVADMSAKLAAYTGLVESARANNRQGFVIGSAYLREASSLMQTALLPSAQKIYSGNLAALNGDQRDVGSVPTISLVLLGIVLAAVVVGSVILVGRTNRQFNLGLIVAAVAALLVIGWIVVATRFAAGNIEHSQAEGTAKFEHLAKARILAQQARTDETLELIARSDITGREKSFDSRMDELTALLAGGPRTAADAVAKWTASHRKQVEAYEGGDYPAAVAQAIGPEPDGSAAQFTAVEASLRNEIQQTRAMLRDRVASAGAQLAWSPTGTLALMVAAAVVAVVGLWPRLKEFL
ncbi:hypothetical protein [Mycobacterium sp. MMS18-G62]